MSWDDYSDEDYQDILAGIIGDFGAYGAFLEDAIEKYGEEAGDWDSDFHHLLFNANESGWSDEYGGDRFELMDYLYDIVDDAEVYGFSSE